MLKSFALEAANEQLPAADIKSKQSQSVACTKEEAISFLAKAYSGSTSTEEGRHGMRMIRQDNDEVVSLSAQFSENASQTDSSTASALGGTVHRSVFSK